MDGSAEVPTDTLPLPSGQMPLLGFGTWQIRGPAAVNATAAALEVGYRHLDTATIYGNEGEVGRGLRDSGIPRSEVFLTTKCPPQNAGREQQTLEQSLELLGTEYVDLWLIHWVPQRRALVPMWEAFVAAREAGLVRDVGVSNFDGSLIDRLSSATGVVPAVDQIEWSPVLFDPAVVEEHRSRGVVLEGYSGLKGGVLDHPVVRRVAQDHGRTPAQVVIRWHLQHQVVVIPKSSRPDRIRANAEVGGFSLSDEEMAALDDLGRP